MKIVVKDTKKETIDVAEIDSGLNYIVSYNEKDPFRWSRVLKFVGKGSVYGDSYYTWVLLFSEHLQLSTQYREYNRNRLFKTKKEAVEHYMSLNSENVILSFRDQEEFIKYLKSKI